MNVKNDRNWEDLESPPNDYYVQNTISEVVLIGWKFPAPASSMSWKKYVHILLFEIIFNSLIVSRFMMKIILMHIFSFCLVF